MPLPTRAVDASFDQLTVEEANCLNQSSWPVYVQCLWTAIAQPPPRVISLRTAKNAGLLIAGYISLNSSGDGANHVAAARAGIPDDLWGAMDFVAIDVELYGIREAQVMTALKAVEDMGKKTTVYTSWHSWNDLVIPNNPAGPARAGYSLWNAIWDLNPAFDFPTIRFGGWKDSDVFMEQWSGGTRVCNQFVDRNTIQNPELVYGVTHDDIVQPAQEIMKQLLTLTVPIHGAGGQPPTFYQLLHYAWHGGPGADQKYALKSSVAKLRAATVEANNSIATHIEQHNTSGGMIDRVSGDALNRMADLLDQIEEELRAAGE